MQIAAVENAKFATLLRSFEAGDWPSPPTARCGTRGRGRPRRRVRHRPGIAARVRPPGPQGRPLIADIGGQYWWDG